MISLSLVMIVKNEANFLDACLRSLENYVDEIVIVDTGSTDETVEIARKHGANVFATDWADDFAKARNYSLEKATCDWIIRLDADEEFAQDSASNIKSTIQASTKDIISIDIFDEMNAESFSQPRIFRNFAGLRYEGAIHEQLVYDDREKPHEVHYSELKVVHHGYRPELVDMSKKEARNREILEASLENDPENDGLRYHYAAHLEQLGLLDLAVENFKKIRTGGPELIGALASRRIVDSLMKARNYQRAAEEAESALKTYPNYTDVWFLAGICYLSLSNISKAKSFFEQCVKLGPSPKGLPSTPGSSDTLASLFLGFCYAQEGDMSKAGGYFQKSISAIRRDAEILAFLAKLFLMQNAPSVAKKKFEELADLTDPRVRHISGIYFPDASARL